jgi:hypothetical protein
VPRHVLEPPPDEHAGEWLLDHDAQDERVARARRRDALADDGAAQLVLDVDQVGKLGHAASLAFGAASVQTAFMPLFAGVALTITVMGCVAFLANGVRHLRRRKRNLEHWEKGEPLEGVGDWD